MGPLLFLMNLFADDSIKWDTVTDPIITTSNINNDLKSITKWANDWHMKINADKNNVLTISCKKEKVAYPNLSIDVLYYQTYLTINTLD